MSVNKTLQTDLSSLYTASYKQNSSQETTALTTFLQDFSKAGTGAANSTDSSGQMLLNDVLNDFFPPQFLR